jgi:DNA topoisomerase VI subunit B
MASSALVPQIFDLNFGTRYAKATCSLEQAIVELLANALDANEANGVKARPELTIVESTSGSGVTIRVEDQGRGIEPPAFVLGGGEGRTSARGMFGIGLKDAIAVLVANSLHVAIKSMTWDYRFELKTGGAGVKTFHAIPSPPQQAYLSSMNESLHERTT